MTKKMTNMEARHEHEVVTEKLLHDYKIFLFWKDLMPSDTKSIIDVVTNQQILGETIAVGEYVVAFIPENVDKTDPKIVKLLERVRLGIDENDALDITNKFV